MDNYRMSGVANIQDSDLTIHATHPAPAGTHIVYADRDGSTHQSPVLLWGVLDDGAVVPLTLSGVWDGVSNRNNFVLHPDGSCGKFEEGWPTMAEAVEAVRQFDD